MPITRIGTRKPKTDADKSDLRLRLEQLAEARGVNVGKLGTLAGCNHSHMYGAGNLTIATLRKLAEHHGVSLDWLVLGQGPMEGAPFFRAFVDPEDLGAIEAARSVGYSLSEIQALLHSDARPKAGAPASAWLLALEEQRDFPDGSNSRLLLKD